MVRFRLEDMCCRGRCHQSHHQSHHCTILLTVGRSFLCRAKKMMMKKWQLECITHNRKMSSWQWARFSNIIIVICSLLLSFFTSVTTDRVQLCAKEIWAEGKCASMQFHSTLQWMSTFPNLEHFLSPNKNCYLSPFTPWQPSSLVEKFHKPLLCPESRAAKGLFMTFLLPRRHWQPSSPQPYEYPSYWADDNK